MTIYILGQSGMLGNYVYEYLKNKYETIGVNRYTNINFSDPPHVYVSYNTDLLDLLSHKLKENDVIINCMGIIPQRNNTSKIDYIRVNTLLPQILYEECNKIKAKFIHITTDCVFSGNKDFYHEYSCHDSIDVYGKTKSLGEPDDATIIRTSIIGEEKRNKKSLLEFVKKNKNINGYINHYWNGVTCLQLAKIIDEMLCKNIFWKGVKHIFSPDALSKFNLIRLIAEIYELNIDIKAHQTEKHCYRILISKRDEINFDIPSIREQIIEQKKFGENIFNEC